MARKRRVGALPTWEKPFHVGVDENGLGPRLGPLIVTSVLARASLDGARVVASPPPRALRRRLGDSKDLVAFRDSSLGEAWARALLARHGRGDGNPAAMPQRGPHQDGLSSPDEVMHALSIEERGPLREACPEAHVNQCWSVAGETFGAETARVRQCARDLDRLATLGVEVLEAKVAIVCAKRLCDASGRGMSRFDVDLHAMERLVLAARQSAGDEVFATCGKVGGFAFYPARFGPLAGRLYTSLDEGRARSVYRIPGVGQVAFVRDADASHVLVCMASLIGKWVRDLLMRRIVRHHRERDPDLPDASGYHDPVTTRFIASSAETRARSGLPDECFERRSLRC